MSRSVRHCLRGLMVVIVAMFLSSGAVVAAFLDCSGNVGAAILWLILPLSGLFLTAGYVNRRYLIPSLLLKRRYVSYSVALFLVSYMVPLSAFLVEYVVRETFSLGHRIADYLSPWILADSLSSAMLVLAMLVGMSLMTLYRKWKARVRMEETLSEELDRRLCLVRERLNPDYLFAGLDEAAKMADTSPEEANRLIRGISDRLREQLYELPGMDEVMYPESDDTLEPAGRDGFSASALITALAWRWLRHLLLNLVNLLIACGAFFDAPDSPVFSCGRATGVLSLYLILTAIAYGNIYLLFPVFLRRGKERLYMIAVAVFLTAFMIICVIAQIVTYDPSLYCHPVPVYIMVISTVGTFFTLGLFLGGTASLLSLKGWIDGAARVAGLKAETARLEFSYLRKQINPHFIFNVLNNAGILAYDEPALARKVLSELQELLQYQLRDTHRVSTTVGAELMFLRNYLSLEKIRHDSFEFIIEAEDGLDDAGVPTLLFIPFVENAVKHSSVVSGVRLVEVCFSRGAGKLVFLCRNSCRYDSGIPRPGERGNKLSESTACPGGLGLTNTRRRLELLYGDRFSLTQVVNENKFETLLTIPFP